MTCRRGHTTPRIPSGSLKGRCPTCLNAARARWEAKRRAEGRERVMPFTRLLQALREIPPGGRRLALVLAAKATGVSP